jgi:hypothetical protein
LRLLQPHLEIFYIDTLLFQAGTTISWNILSADSSGKKHYFALCEKGRVISKGLLIDKQALAAKLDDSPQLVVKKDFVAINAWQNFLDLKDYFLPLKSFDFLDSY